MINKIIKNLPKKLSTQELWWLLEKVTGKSKTQLLTQKELELTGTQEEKLNEFINLRVNGKKPLQYILGSVPFCDLEILVEPPILIPRPETEEWCSWVIEQRPSIHSSSLKASKNTRDENQNKKNIPLKILDLCCGTGCIGLALAKALPNAAITGIDKNPRAIKLSEKNKNHNKIENIKFIESDLFTNIPENTKFDLIVSNPPYIPEKDFKTLSPDVTQWEDKDALVAQDEGLAFYKKIVSTARDFLNPPQNNLPSIVFEFGINQEDDVKKILEQNNFKNIEVFKDSYNVARWISARL
jgi:release factor glutamine methyltransferase